MNSKQLEAEEFLKTLYSRYFKDHDGYVEIRLKGSSVDHIWLPNGEVSEAHWAAIVEANADNHIYFGVNPRSLSKAKKQDDIKNIVCLWADMDGKDFKGGKVEALKAAEAFPLPPTAMVDSGHGYHLYWVLSEPLIGLEGEARIKFKRILAGVIAGLGGDRSKIHVDACLRLPGTINIKNDEGIECRIFKLDKERFYGLEDFADFEDKRYQEPQGAEEPLPSFGTKTRLIRLGSAEAAQADVEKLEVSSRIKQFIITGALPEKDARDKTRSGRDMSVVCSLIANDYDYATIRSVFFNPFLGCSDRIMSKGEDDLQWDVRRGIEYIGRKRTEETPGARRISEIRRIKGMTLDEKRKAMLQFITSDLLTSGDPAGRGFKDAEQNEYYFFDDHEKILMNLESTDFYTYTRDRYGIPEKEFCEVRDEIKTKINWTLRTYVTPRRFAYWDPKKLILYISNHDNNVYRLDGTKIETCENGVDGVFFEHDPTLAPFAFDPAQKVINYFETPRPSKTVQVGGTGIKLPAYSSLGLSLDLLFHDESLVRRYLIDRASFVESKDNPMSPSEQRLLLAMYFYSLFFESIMREKPIACFVGQKESGKSFIATSIGKIFFGDRFEACHEPGTVEDLKTVLAGNYYLVFDNLDKSVSADALNAMCVAATGGTIEKRKLYKNMEIVKATPHCFLAITSREGTFKREDFVSRLLLFNTEKIGRPLSRSFLFRALLDQRSAIMTEVLVNLNSIVKILRIDEERRHRQGPDWEPPKNITRIADWEDFWRRVSGFGLKVILPLIMQKMNEKKDQFTIEDQYVYVILNYLIYEKGELVRGLSPQELYSLLADTAVEMKLKDFQRYHGKPMSVSKFIRANREALERRFKIEIFEHANHKSEYTFDPLPTQEHTFELTKEQLLAALELSEGQEAELPAKLDELKTKKVLDDWGTAPSGDGYWLDMWLRDEDKGPRE